MSLVSLTNAEKALVDAIVSTGHVPESIEILSSECLTHSDILEIEEFMSRNSDQRSKTFINNLIRDNK